MQIFGKSGGQHKLQFQRTDIFQCRNFHNIVLYAVKFQPAIGFYPAIGIAALNGKFGTVGQGGFFLKCSGNCLTVDQKRRTFNEIFALGSDGLREEIIFVPAIIPVDHLGGKSAIFSVSHGGIRRDYSGHIKVKFAPFADAGVIEGLTGNDFALAVRDFQQIRSGGTLNSKRYADKVGKFTIFVNHFAGRIFEGDEQLGTVAVFAFEDGGFYGKFDFSGVIQGCYRKVLSRYFQRYILQKEYSFFVCRSKFIHQPVGVEHGQRRLHFLANRFVGFELDGKSRQRLRGQQARIAFLNNEKLDRAIHRRNKFKLLLNVAKRGIAPADYLKRGSVFGEFEGEKVFIIRPVTFARLGGKVSRRRNSCIEKAAAEIHFKLLGYLAQTDGFPRDRHLALPEKCIIYLHGNLGAVIPLGVVVGYIFQRIGFAARCGTAKVVLFAAVAQVQFKRFKAPHPGFGIGCRMTFQNRSFSGENGSKIHIKIIFIVRKCRIVFGQFP